MRHQLTILTIERANRNYISILILKNSGPFVVPSIISMRSVHLDQRKLSDPAEQCLLRPHQVLQPAMALAPQYVFLLGHP